MAKKIKPEHPTPPVKFEYLCPACSDVAIQTSNKMMNVPVNCKKCGKLIELTDVRRYRTL